LNFAAKLRDAILTTLITKTVLLTLSHAPSKAGQNRFKQTQKKG
jgi:hypothetical protein